MVNEKTFSDLCPGMDVDAGYAVGVLAHDPGNQGNIHQVQLVGDTMDGDCGNVGIADDDLFKRPRRRITVKSRLYVGLEYPADLRDPA